MRALKCLLYMCLAVPLVAACSDDSSTTSDGPVITDGPLPADGGGGGDSIIVPDGPEPDSGGPAAALQTVVDTLTLPTSGTEYAADIDGDGDQENKIGEIFGALALAKLDLQTEIDGMLASDQLVILFELFATSLTDDAAAKLQYHEGSKLPAVVNTYGIANSSPPNVVLDCKLAGGKLEGGPGEFVIPVPLGTPVNVTIKKTQLKADVSSSGMANGQINGAIPWDDVDKKIIPAIAVMLDSALTGTSVPQSTKDVITTLFDADKSGSISEQEVRNSVIKAFLEPDVDLDGDKKNDALSVGMAFTAASCTIQR